MESQGEPLPLSFDRSFGHPPTIVWMQDGEALLVASARHPARHCSVVECAHCLEFVRFTAYGTNAHTHALPTYGSLEDGFWDALSDDDAGEARSVPSSIISMGFHGAESFANNCP